MVNADEGWLGSGGSPYRSVLMSVIWLDDPRAREHRLVGGKAAALAALAARHTVPDGFCVTAPDTDITAAYAELARRSGSPVVAVRSSAVGEDSAEASFAGQHETILNVSGADAVADAVRRCWASVDSAHAAAYRVEHGVADDDVRFAVLVQQMIAPEAAAYAFSVDPVSGAQEVVLDVVRGLGEAIASGAVIPDHYRIDRTSLRIAGRAITGDSPVLDDERVLALARLTLTLETEIGRPVDIECALTGDTIHLLQCRPVTAVGTDFPVRWADPRDAERTWFLDLEHGSAAFPPLAQDAVQRTVNAGLRAACERGNGRSCGRFAFVNGYAYFLTVRRPGETPQEMQARFAPLIRELSADVRRYWDHEGLPALREDSAALGAIRLETLDGPPLAAAWDAAWTHAARMWVVHFQLVWATYGAMEAYLATRAELLPGADQQAGSAVLQGHSVELQRVDDDLHSLAVATRQRGTVPEAALGAFLERHGHLGQMGLDLSAPPWADQPELIRAQIERQAADGAEEPAARRARLAAQCDAIIAADRAHLGDRPDDLARYDAALTLAIGAAPIAEDHNYWIDRMSLAYLHRIALDAGRRLAVGGCVTELDDVFFLHIDEVRDLLLAPRDERELVTRRRTEHKRNLRRRPPAYLGVAPVEAAPLSASADLRGTGACAGRAKGHARIVRTTADFAKVGRGDIVLCRTANQSFVPLFSRAAGMITENGGLLSHASVCAREFGLPAVVGVPQALERIADGRLVELDGRSGQVWLAGGEGAPEFPINDGLALQPGA